MPTHTEIATSAEQAERAPLVMPGGPVLASSRPCPVCGEAMTGRKTSACSDKCRAALSRRTRAAEQAERDQRVRGLLEAAVRVLGEDR
jgi:predicted nucleic acid-binding Zn ribbon protein